MMREGDGEPDPTWEGVDAPAAPHPPDPPRGPWVDQRFERLCVLGQGGMGEVWQVRDVALDRVVAMKVIRSELNRSSILIERFRAEARVTARLAHPGVVPVYDLGVLPDGSLYYTMQEIRGRTLEHAIREVAAASTPERWGVGAGGATFLRLIDVFVQVCDTLAFAHQAGIVHRDLKPQNVMVGDFGEVRVVDWGLVKWLDLPPAPAAADTFGASALDGPSASEEGWVPTSGTLDPDPGPGRAWGPTRAGQVVGTVGFMAPEQARGEPVGKPTDVFALGAILWCILTGDPPLRDPTAVAAALEARPRVPAGLAAICARAMRPSSAERYADADELRTAVSAWFDRARTDEEARGRAAEADRAFEAIPSELAGRAREVLLSLVDPAGKATARRRSEVAAVVAEELVRAGLVIDRDGELSLAVDLVARWGRLRSWRESEGPGLRVRHALVAAAAQWEAHGRRPALLWTSDVLQELEAWRMQRAPELSTTEVAFVERSVGQRRTRRRAAMAAGGAAVAVLALGAAGLYLRGEQAQAALVDAQIARVAEQAALRQAERRALSADAARHEAVGHTHAALALHRAVLELAGGADAVAADAIDRLSSGSPPARILPTPGVTAFEAVWSPDESRVATLHRDRRLRVWTIADGATERELPFDAVPLVVGWSPDGTRVVTVHEDGATWWTDLGTLERQQLSSQETSFSSVVAWSPDGTRFSTTVGRDVPRLWDAATRAELASLDCPRCRLDFASDEVLITVGSSAEGVRRFDARSGAELTALSAVGPVVSQLDRASGSVFGVMGEADARLLAWDLATGETRWSVPLPQGSTWVLRVAPGGEHLVTGTLGRATLQVWDGRTGSLVQEVPIGQTRIPAGAVAVSPEGVLAVGGADGRVALVHMTSGFRFAELGGHDGRVSRLRFSADGRHLLSAGTDDTVRVWDVPASGTVAPCDGAVLLGPTLTASGGIAAGVAGGRACVLDAGRRVARAVDVAASTEFGAVFLSPGGTRLLESSGLEVAVYDAPTGRRVAEWTWNEMLISGLVVRNEDRLVDHHPRAVEERLVSTGAIVWSLPEVDVTELIVEPGAARWVVGVVADGSAKVWDAERKGEVVHALLPGRQFDARVAVSSATGVVAAADREGTVRVWTAGQDTPRFEVPGALVDHLALSSDGRLVAAARPDRVALLDVATGEEVGALPTLGAAAGLWSLSGNRLLVSDHQRAVVWDLADPSAPRRRLEVPAADARRWAASDDELRLADQSGLHWWPIPAAPPSARAADRSNWRVCRGSFELVPVVPFPSDPSPFAPEDGCDPHLAIVDSATRASATPARTANTVGSSPTPTAAPIRRVPGTWPRP